MKITPAQLDAFLVQLGLKEAVNYCPIPKYFPPPNLKIKGSESFKAATLKALDEISRTPTGKLLLTQIEYSGKSVNIVETGKGNRVSDFDEGAYKKGEKYGSGSNSTISFNPTAKVIGPEKWADRPPAIGLAHELVHAAHIAEGNVSERIVQNDKRPDPTNPGRCVSVIEEEVSAAGIPPFGDARFNENMIRAEWMPPQPQREWY